MHPTTGFQCNTGKLRVFRKPAAGLGFVAVHGCDQVFDGIKTLIRTVKVLESNSDCLVVIVFVWNIQQMNFNSALSIAHSRRDTNED